MKLVFRLRFYTKFGQSLLLSGDHEILGNGRIENAVRMQYLSPEFWQTVVPTCRANNRRSPVAPIIPVHYILQNEDGSTIQDGGNERVINPPAFKHKEVLIIDSWNIPGLIQNIFYTEPFQKVLLSANQTRVTGSPPPSDPTHRFPKSRHRFWPRDRRFA